MSWIFKDGVWSATATDMVKFKNKNHKWPNCPYCKKEFDYLGDGVFIRCKLCNGKIFVS
jgi:tRNA(Ile2) C34 agmatinyltransferase TiaS